VQYPAANFAVTFPSDVAAAAPLYAAALASCVPAALGSTFPYYLSAKFAVRQHFPCFPPSNSAEKQTGAYRYAPAIALSSFEQAFVKTKRIMEKPAANLCQVKYIKLYWWRCLIAW
jgi:hypothetical protein